MSNTELHRRAKEIFLEAVKLAAEERAGFLDRACGGDPAIEVEVRSLLREDQASPAFLDSRGPLRPALFDPPAVALADRLKHGGLKGSGLAHSGLGLSELPVRLASYTIVRKLGEGGMGAVYEALQDNPRRRVALKVTASRLTSEALVKRFEHESQVLGLLDHPGVARIYEAGTAETAGGRVPYFAMELIEGKPLTDFVREHRLDLPQKLGLVAAICDAVEHAHQRGVIHRDLKPGNILVDREGNPKVLDFGIARATDPDHQLGTLHTQTGQILGTLSYMSPEQASGDSVKIDQKSDIYSLGVILYELITGRLPYRLGGLSIPAAAQTICRHDPTRLTEIDRRIPADVDWIVLKALEKEKERRYVSAADLGEDIRRFLRNEPVHAREQTGLYRLMKFARRNRALVAGLSMTFAALLAGTVVSTWFAIEAHERSKEARSSEEVASKKSVEAVEAARKASDARDRAIWEATRANLDAARSNLGFGVEHHPSALDVLEAVPAALRGWEWEYLRSRVLVLTGPGREISLLEYSPSGDRLAALADDGVHLWDGRSLESIAFLRSTARAAEPWEVTFSPDGSQLAIALGDEPVMLVDARTGGTVRRLDADASGATCLEFIPGERRRLLAAGSKDGRIRLWDVATGAVSGRLEGHTGRVHSLSSAGEGRWLASGSADGTVRIWDLETGTQKGAEMRGHKAGAHHIEFNRQATRIASSSFDKTTRLWDAATGAEVAIMPGSALNPYRPPFAFSPDGARLVTSAGLTGACIRSAEDGSELLRLAAQQMPILCLGYTPDGQRVISTTFDGSVVSWNATTGERIEELANERSWVMSLAMRPDGEFIALETGGNRVHVVETRRRDHGVLRGHFAAVTSVEFSPDGSWLATSSGDGNVRLWCAETLDLLGAIATGGTANDIAVSPDGRSIATACGDIAGLSVLLGTCRGREVVLWDAATGEEIRILEGHPPRVSAVEFSHDGGMIATGGSDGRIRLFDASSLDAPSAKPVATLAGHRVGIYNLAFSPDDGRIASAAEDGTVRAWSREDGRQVFSSRAHGNYVHCVAFSPDGSVLASGGRDGRVRFWDPETGAARGDLDARCGFVNGLLFLPDGGRLVVAGFDGTLGFWDPVRRQEVLSIPAHEGFIYRLAVSPDGRRIATAGNDRTARVFDTRSFPQRRLDREATLRRREEAGPLVSGLIESLKTPAAVAGALRGDPSLDAALRREALKELFRRTRGQKR